MAGCRGIEIEREYLETQGLRRWASQFRHEFINYFFNNCKIQQLTINELCWDTDLMICRCLCKTAVERNKLWNWRWSSRLLKKIMKQSLRIFWRLRGIWRKGTQSPKSKHPEPVLGHDVPSCTYDQGRRLPESGGGNIMGRMQEAICCEETRSLHSKLQGNCFTQTGNARAKIGVFWENKRN